MELTAHPPSADRAVGAGAAFGGADLGNLSPRFWVPLFVGTLVVVTLPLWMTTFPPLLDYPFHLARVHILDALGREPFLREVYERQSLLLPNVGMDVIVLGLAQVMPIEAAGRVFLALTVALILSGTAFLHRALSGRLQVWPLVAALFLHNWILLFGFLNFLLGVGVLLWWLGAWIIVYRRVWWQRVTIGVPIGLALFFSHMLVVGLCAIAIAAVELERLLFDQPRPPLAAIVGNLAAAGVPFVLPAALFLASATSGEAGSGIYYQPQWWWKPFAFARTFMSGNLWVDLVTLGALMGLVILLGQAARLRFAREIRILLPLMAAVFVVIPFDFFSVAGVDIRVPIVLWFLILAGTRVRVRRPRLAAVFVLGCAGLFIARTLWIAHDWGRFDHVTAGLVRGFGRLPPASTLFVATAAREAENLAEWLSHWRPQISHVASFAVLSKPVFVVTTGANPSKQPIVVRPPYDRLYRFQSGYGGFDVAPIRVATAGDLVRVGEAIRGLWETVAHDLGRPAGSGPYLLLLYPQLLGEPLPERWSTLAVGNRFVLLDLSAEEADRTRPLR